MDFTIKEVPASDLLVLADFHCRYVKRHPFSYFKNYYGKNPNLFVAAYKGKEMIGFAWGHERKDLVILEGIAVNAKYWRREIGSKILKFFEKQVKKIGRHKISVGAAENIDKFYLANKFKPTHILIRCKRKSKRIPATKFDPKERAKIKKKLRAREAIYIYEKELSMR